MIAQVVYRDVPEAVSRISAFEWREGAPRVSLPIATARVGADITVVFSTTFPVVFVLQRPDAAYLLDGPIRASDLPVDRTVDRIWRRSAAGSVVRGVAATPPLTWVGESGASTMWPVCAWTDATHWECIGIPLEAAGVVVAPDSSHLLSAIVNDEPMPSLRTSAWARMVIVADRGEGAPPRLRMTAARPLAPMRRSGALRLETAILPDVRVGGVSPGVYWVAGDSSPPPDAWLEIRSARSGPQYVPLGELASAAVAVPMRIALEDRRDVRATVLFSTGAAAAGTLVTAYRLIDAESDSTSIRQQPRRVLASEATTDESGAVLLDGMGDADYEIVAWHPQGGRGSVRVAPTDPTAVTIKLLTSGIVRGRVLIGGKPAAGVDVLSVPDPAAYIADADPMDVKGGDTRTDASGRFLVGLAPRGGGELRIGGGPNPIVRLRLPGAAVPIVELGDIELGSPLKLTATLDQDPGCELRAAGPIGRSGLQIIAASRLAAGTFAVMLPEEGSWEFVLLCGRAERSLVPSVVRIGLRDGPFDVRFTVR